MLHAAASMASAARRSALLATAVTTLQTRGARATPALRRYAQQQLQSHAPTAPSDAAAAASAVANGARRAVVAVGSTGGRRRATRYVRVKSGPTPSKPPPALTKAQQEAAAAAERTHALNHRLGLSRNALMLRFSNENSYLNWARNGVLASAVGVAMYAQEHHRGAQLSGAGLLLLGFGYIGAGTAKYIHYILRFRQVMELSWLTVLVSSTHASGALLIWLTATASFLESVPLELDAMLLTEPIIDYLPFRIRQGLIETYSLYLDDLEHHTDEHERVLRAIRGEQYEASKAVVPPLGVAPVLPPVVETPSS